MKRLCVMWLIVCVCSVMGALLSCTSDADTEDRHYVVSFDSDGGTFVPAQLVLEGNTIVEPALPTKERCTFVNWYDGDDVYDFSAPVSCNLTLTAHWMVQTVVDENMLSDSYTVDYRATLCLSAPMGAAQYEWKVTVGENANGEEVGTEYVLGNEQDLVLYIPVSPLKRWSVYTLTLTVTKATGLSYTDSALLCIY